MSYSTNPDRFVEDDVTLQKPINAKWTHGQTDKTQTDTQNLIILNILDQSDYYPLLLVPVAEMVGIKAERYLNALKYN